MRGLQFLIDQRRRGVRPPDVVLQDTPYDPELLPNWVQYEPADVPELTDLRVLVGMLVSVHGRDPDLVRRWAQAAMEAGARTVLTLVYWRRGEVFQAEHGTLRVNGEDA